MFGLLVGKTEKDVVSCEKGFSDQGVICILQCDVLSISDRKDSRNPL